MFNNQQKRNLLLFLNRVDLKGVEAEAMVELKQIITRPDPKPQTGLSPTLPGKIQEKEKKKNG